MIRRPSRLLTLAALFVVGEVADALTMRPATELNVIVIALGSSAYIAKGAVIVLGLSVAFLLAQPGDPRFTRLRRIRATLGPALLVGGGLYGLFGAWTNLG